MTEEEFQRKMRKQYGGQFTEREAREAYKKHQQTRSVKKGKSPWMGVGKKKSSGS